MALYHYTTEKRYTDIIASGVLYSSGDIQTDAAYGEGWYFTDLPPHTCEKIRMQHCWNRTTFYQRSKYYLQIEVNGGRANWKREHVYVVPRSAYVSFTFVNGGQTPECLRKPCRSCSINPEK